MSRDAVPFVVIVQSRLYDAANPLRLVAPLYRADAILRASEPDWDRRLAPSFRVLETDVLLNPLGMTPVPAAHLGQPVASLADDVSATMIIAAIDRALSRGFG